MTSLFRLNAANSPQGETPPQETPESAIRRGRFEIIREAVSAVDVLTTSMFVVDSQIEGPSPIPMQRRPEDLEDAA